ncbi:MAG: AMP-binding protein [Candidatus Lambdaproteobacteria bacterium]|nr:AMP-binding protein [Candidatus Lambdaproteobacteria bacterium]
MSRGRIISGTRSITLEDVAARAARAAQGLHELGVGEGDAIALMLRNDFAFFEATLAAVTLGAYAVPVNWHFTAEEAGYIFEDAGAKAVVIHADLLPQVRAALRPELPVFVVQTPPEILNAYRLAPEQGRLPEGATSWEAWLPSHQPWTAPPKSFRSSMIYTSGTTGHPKGVRRRPMNAEQNERVAQLARDAFGITPGLRTVMTGPMYHSAPNFFAMHSFRAGGTIVLQPRFDPGELLRLVERHQVTSMHMVPTMFVRLLKLPPDVRRRYDLSSLRTVVHAAAPCPPDIKRQMIDWFGPVIVEYYGGTESGAVTFCDTAQWLAHPGTVGTPVTGGTVRIYGDDGRVLPPGQVGDVYMRLAFYPEFTYFGKDDKRREIERDGLITCGDMGYLDEDGFLYLCDRRRDMVISGGVNIYPAEIEAALHNVPGVRDCAVFGIPDEEFGETLAAVIAPEDGAALTPTGVQEALRPHLAAYKIPRHVEFRDELPREDSGKIFKRKLRQPFWERAGRNI